VLQAFSAHYSGVRNAIKVPAISRTPLNPKSALALATAAVSPLLAFRDSNRLIVVKCERAFRLWANGDLTITNNPTGFGKTGVTVNKVINPATGCDTKDTAFVRGSPVDPHLVRTQC
jgi:hypothetical protein